MNEVAVRAGTDVAPVTELDRRIAAIVTPQDALDVRGMAKRCEEAAKILGQSVQEVNEYARRFLQATWIFGDLVKGIPAHRPTTNQEDNKGRIDAPLIGTKKQRQYARQFIRAVTEYECVPDYIEECNEQGVGASVAGGISWVTGDRSKATAAQNVEPLDGRYDVIVIDPPWPMKKIARNVRRNQTEHQTNLAYPIMSEAELAELTLPAADNCHLWCWTTHKFLPMALRLLEAWQFKYVCTSVWHKPGGFQPHGLPQFNCEFALYARRGKPKFSSTKSLKVCFEAPRGEHSEKPAFFYDMIARCTSGHRIDIYNGGRDRDGFVAWGKRHVMAS